MTPKVAVLGTGHWGRNLVRNLDHLGALAGFCDLDRTLAARTAAQYPQAKPYRNVDEALTDPSVAAVAIATPAATHGRLTRQALEAGRHVFVEKPLCLDLTEGRTLASLADARSLILMVGHLLLYHPAFVAAAEAVRTGRIGRLRYLYSNRASLGKIRREENALWSFAPHDISMMLTLIGCMPRRVVCTGAAWLSPEVADLTLSHFDFGDSVSGHIFVSWLHPYKDHKLVVVGEAGMVVFNDATTGPDKLQLYPHRVDFDGTLPVIGKADALPLPYGPEEPLNQEMRHFLDCCAGGGRPRSDAREGLRVLAVLDMCQRALAGGGAVTLEAEPGVW